MNDDAREWMDELLNEEEKNPVMSEEQKKFRKKPVVIDAMQFTNENKDRCFNFVTCNHYADFDKNGNLIMRIETLEGTHTVILGDWIIKGVKGEFYPCKPDIFKLTYEDAEVLTADQRAKVLKLCDGLEGALTLTHEGYLCVHCGNIMETSIDFIHKPGCLKELAKQLKNELSRE